jgi:acyl-CoA thioesterase FadM
MALSELNLKYLTPLRVRVSAHISMYCHKSLNGSQGLIIVARAHYICIFVQRGAKFVVRVRLVQIKGSRIFFEQLIETLPDREVISAYV